MKTEINVYVAMINKKSSTKSSLLEEFFPKKKSEIPVNNDPNNTII